VIVVAIVLTAVAGTAALVAAVLAVRAHRRADELTGALARLSDALATGDDREALLAVALDTARALAGARAAGLWTDTGAAVVARMVRGEEVVAVGDRVPHGTVPECTMSTQLHARTREYGLLCLYGGDPDRRADVLAFAARVDAAIEATYRHEEARRLSITDGLTGLWNRRQFDIRCVEELDRAARFQEPFAVVLCDIDDFKRINDTRGHLVGDAVLVEVAKRLVDNTRGVDLVARYGGEEFGLVLPRTDMEGALRVADHVREVVAATPVPTDAGPLTVTLSAGVACHPIDGTTIPALTAAADAGLYVAKGAGKNQVRPAPATENS
jgi:diguanylate cyclase (GGDEF)-like protein